MSEQIKPYKTESGMRWSVQSFFTDEDGIFHKLRRRGFTTEREARAWSRKAELMAREGMPQEARRKAPGESADHPATWTTQHVWDRVVELLRARLKETTWRNLGGAFKVHVAPRVGGKVFSKLSARDLEALACVPYAVPVVRCLLKWSPRAGAVLPSAKFDPPKRVESQRMIWFEPDEAKRALALLPEKFRPMFLISLGTGCRIGELCGLQFRDFDLKHGVLTIERQLSIYGKITSPKSNKSRTVPLTETTLRGLHMLPQGAPNDLLFPHLRAPFAKAVRALQVPLSKAVTVHAIRHTTATWMVLAGVGPAHVAKVLGHGTLAVTEKYYHLAPKHLVDGVGAVDAALL
ncbi:site-specific integrase [Myxococcota bacterium]|nr:site-specific integrase [Myxococcota bacterium]